MKHSRGAMLAAGCMAGMMSGVLLSGCAGPSTRVLPRADTSQTYELPQELPVLEEVNPFYLQESLEILTRVPRPGGSRGESDAARYMQQLLESYGYTVELQRFRYDEGRVVTGSNVIAVRQAPAPEADILIISTHHDTREGSPGANNNASGVVTMLETARLLSRLPTDTELRFVSVSGGEDNRLGVRHYVESLTKRERERIIGAVDLDTIGYVSDETIVLNTLDGEPTMLGDLLQEASRDVLAQNWQYTDLDRGNAAVFTAGEIAAVVITQSRQAFEDGTPFDVSSTVDIERVSQVMDVISQTVSRVMSTDTPSMSAKAHHYNDLRNHAYVQRTREVFPFGADIHTVEEQVGLYGTKALTNRDAAGNAIEKYQFHMKWFDVDQIILSEYYFVNGKLESISLDADGAGIEFEDMKDRLSAVYGEPVGQNSGPYGIEYNWRDAVRRKFFALIPISGGYDVEIREYSTEKTVYEQRMPDGTILLQNQADERIPRVAELIQKMVPAEQYQQLGCITFYTDGIGMTDGYLTQMETDASGQRDSDLESDREPEPVSAVWELAIDVEDAMTPEGAWQNETETARLLAGFCGQMLEADATQPYYAEFAARFLTGEAPDSEEDEPAASRAGEPHAVVSQVGIAPGMSAQESLPPPDFVTSFEHFVLTGGVGETQGAWSERVGFFYEFEPLTEYRKWVRDNLKLHSGE